MRVKRDDEKLIGLIVGGISNEFSKDIIKGVSNSIPYNSNVRLAILPGELMVQSFQGDGVAMHNYMYNSIYNLGSVCKMDGIIIAMGSVGWALNDEQIMEFLGQFNDIPLVLIASDIEGYTTVNYDNKMGINEAIDVLVGVYGVGCIGMLGGYDENIDSVRRRDIYFECLRENGLKFRESMYVTSDMSENSEEAAEKLLDANPDLQAVFCVNDASAVGLYNVMRKRGIVPGKDLFVFGFDNTRMSAEMVPPLSSVGSESVTLGEKAYDLLMRKINHEQVESFDIPTRLYGRESLPYEKYVFSMRDISNLNDEFIYSMFDDCFYRYSNEHFSRENINLRRLFYEMISRIFNGIKKRYIEMDDFNNMLNLVDIFFKSGAMEYTDVRKYLRNLSRLQVGINRGYKDRDITLINRIFLRMKDDALIALAEMRKKENDEDSDYRSDFRKFIIKGMNYIGDAEAVRTDLLLSMNMMGINNGAYYEFDRPVSREDMINKTYPNHINLVGVLKNKETYLIPASKQRRPLSEIFLQREIKIYNKNFVTFPIFYENSFYGFLLCELNDEIYNRGGIVCSVLSMIVHSFKG